MSETWLDLTTSIESSHLSLMDYKLYCVNNPDNINKRGLCLRNIKLKSSFVLITSDFNCWSSDWHYGDPVTEHGACVNVLTCFYGLHQLIQVLTHLLQNLETFIDIVFNNQSRLIMESGVTALYFGNFPFPPAIGSAFCFAG